MITKDSIETAYSFLHQKQRIYVYSTLDWQKDERQRAAEIKAEMLKEQQEIIRLIEECEHRAEEELQIAQTVLENIKTKL